MRWWTKPSKSWVANNGSWNLWKSHLSGIWIAHGQSLWPTLWQKPAGSAPRQSSPWTSYIPPCGNPADLLQSFESDMDNIPPAIKFKAALPETSKVDFIFVTKANGNVDVVKVVYLPRPVNFQMARSICSGGAFVPVHRPGPWNVKKGVQWLLSQLGGHQSSRYPWYYPMPRFYIYCYAFPSSIAAMNCTNYISAIPSNPCSPTRRIANSQNQASRWTVQITCLQSPQILAALRHPLPTLKNVGFGGLAYIYFFFLCLYLFICLFIYLFIYLFVYLFIYIFIYTWHTYIYIYI